LAKRLAGWMILDSDEKIENCKSLSSKRRSTSCTFNSFIKNRSKSLNIVAIDEKLAFNLPKNVKNRRNRRELTFSRPKIDLQSIKNRRKSTFSRSKIVENRPSIDRKDAVRRDEETTLQDPEPEGLQRLRRNLQHRQASQSRSSHR
jgi:hypothetical protein